MFAGWRVEAIEALVKLGETAERLTQRTVETHLTHAFQKLDISSRAELAAALEPQARPPSPR